MSHKITAFSPLFAYHFILSSLLTHQFCLRQPYLQIQLPKLFQIHFTGPLAMSHSSVESMTDYNGGSSMEQAVWEHAFWHHFNINGTYPALLRVIVVCFFFKSMWITTFLALWGLPQWCEGSRCVFLLFLFFCCLFFFLSMVNLNLTPLKIIYRVNNVQILRGKAKFGVWNWASLGPTLNTWTADASRFRQAWRWDALCMYIGLLMGEAWEAEPVSPSQDIDLTQTLQLTARHSVSDGYFCRITAS